MPKKILIALPPAMLEQIDYIAQVEHRTRSDLVREALRRYIHNFRRGGNHIEDPTSVNRSLELVSSGGSNGDRS